MRLLVQRSTSKHKKQADEKKKSVDEKQNTRSHLLVHENTLTQIHILQDTESISTSSVLFHLIFHHAS